MYIYTYIYVCVCVCVCMCGLTVWISNSPFQLLRSDLYLNACPRQYVPITRMAEWLRRWT